MRKLIIKSGLVLMLIVGMSQQTGHAALPSTPIIFTVYGPGPNYVDAVYAVDSDGSHLNKLSRYDRSPLVRSPDGRFIAFGTYGQSFLVSLDQTVIREFNSLLKAAGMGWSPDGKHFAIVLHPYLESKLEGVYLTDKDGSNPRQLLKTQSTSISWSADSQFLAVVIGGDIYKVNIEGKQKLTRLTNNGAVATDIRWSPDGKYIAFFLDKYGTNPTLYLVDSEGKNRRRIVIDVPSNFRPFSYDWSPDGSYLVITPNLRSHANVFIVEAKSLKVKSLELEPGMCGRAKPSPDGNRLLCRSVIGFKHPGYTTITLSTGEHHAIDIDPGTYTVMDWSPDGKQIALFGAKQIVIFDSDGSNPRPLASTAGLGDLADLLWFSRSSSIQESW
jgi:Tol biopolymer transport system component